MREAEELCDEIAFLKGGHLLTQGSAEELKRAVQPGKVIALHISTDVASALAELPGVLRTNVRDGWVELTVDSEKRVAEVPGRLNALGVDVKKLEVRAPELEEVFVEFAR